MKLLLTALIVLNATCSFSQKLVSEIDIKLKNINDQKADAYVLDEPENNRYSLFLLDRESIHRIVLDENFQATKEKSIVRPDYTYSTMIGHIVGVHNQHLMFSNKSQNQFSWISYENVDQIYINTSNLKLKKESFIEAISDHNKLYLFTVVKRSSVLKMYVFAGPDEYIVQEFDLSEYKFSNDLYPQLFYALRSASNSLKTEIQFQFIDNTIPNPIEVTSKTNKLFSTADKFILTIDRHADKTTVITIDKNDFQYSVKEYPKRMDYLDILYVNSNSMVHGNLLYQLSVSRELMNLRIRDLSDGHIIKEYNAGKEDDISFRNTEIVQEGGISIYTQDTEKNISKTKQALRKIYNSDIGISVYSSYGKIETTIGGYKEVQQNMTPMAMGTPMMLGSTFSMGSGFYLSTGVNPMMFGYANYKNTRSVYFKSLFDKNTLEHISGPVHTNTFDTIKDYSETLEKISLESIFRTNNLLIYGYYLKKDKKYYLRSFYYL